MVSPWGLAFDSAGSLVVSNKGDGSIAELIFTGSVFPAPALHVPEAAPQGFLPSHPAQSQSPVLRFFRPWAVQVWCEDGGQKAWLWAALPYDLQSRDGAGPKMVL